MIQSFLFVCLFFLSFVFLRTKLPFFIQSKCQLILTELTCHGSTGIPCSQNIINATCKWGSKKWGTHISHEIPLLIHIPHCLTEIHKFKDIITKILRQRQEVIEQSMGPFWVQGPMWLYRLHCHEVSPDSEWGVHFDWWEQPWLDHLANYPS